MIEQTENIHKDAELKQGTASIAYKGPTQTEIQAEILEATRTYDIRRLRQLLKLIWQRQNSLKKTPTAILDSWRGERTPGTHTAVSASPPRDWNKFIEQLEHSARRYEVYVSLYKTCQEAIRLVRKHHTRQAFIEQLEDSITPRA